MVGGRRGRGCRHVPYEPDYDERLDQEDREKKVSTASGLHVKGERGGGEWNKIKIVGSLKKRAVYVGVAL